MSLPVHFRTIAAAAVLLVLAVVVTGSALATSHPAKPMISSFSPSKAKPLAKITVDGKNLTGAKTVKVDGMKATFKVDSATKVTVTLPSKVKSGKIALSTAGGTATSSKTLTIT